MYIRCTCVYQFDVEQGEPLMGRRTAQVARRKPVDARPLRVQVLHRSRPLPSLARVTLGGGEIADLTPMGFDQWFRLFLPTGGIDSLRHVPQALTTASYARFMLVPADERPIIRNYTIRAYRETGIHGEGPEIDVDLVAHGSPEEGTCGPASTWAQTCAVGDEVAIIDEGAIYAGPEEAQVLLAADESGLPALAGILRDLPCAAQGVAVVEVPHPDDRHDLGGPDGVEVRWVVRGAPGGRPGTAALAELATVPVPEGEVYAWVAGESDLATSARRHWVRHGIPKAQISFCGYWKSGTSH